MLLLQRCHLRATDLVSALLHQAARALPQPLVSGYDPAVALQLRTVALSPAPELAAKAAWAAVLGVALTAEQWHCLAQQPQARQEGCREWRRLVLPSAPGSVTAALLPPVLPPR